MKRSLTMAVFFTLASPALALDSACEPLIKASEAKISQPAWHSVIAADDVHLEAIKVDGQYFTLMEGTWQTSPMNLDEAERIAIAMMRDGGIKVTDCKDEGTEILDGMKMTVLSYYTEVPGSGMPGGVARLLIGQQDGLPYRATSEPDGTTVTYRYQGVSAP